MGGSSDHFPIISEGGAEEAEFEGLAPGQSDLYDEPASREADNKPVGLVHLIARRSKRKSDAVVCRVIFNFDDGANTLSASGVLPARAGEIVDSGRLAITGGTGDYAGRQGEVVVEVWNPKRWFLDPP